MLDPLRFPAQSYLFYLDQPHVSSLHESLGAPSAAQKAFAARLTSYTYAMPAMKTGKTAPHMTTFLVARVVNRKCW